MYNHKTDNPGKNQAVIIRVKINQKIAQVHVARALNLMVFLLGYLNK